MERNSNFIIRLVTLNCYSIPITNHPRKRLLTVARELGSQPLDLLCFQEIHLWRYATLLSRTLPAFPHRSEWPYLYAPKGGLLTFSRHRIINTRFVLFDKRGQIHTPGAADWLLHKGILITELEISGCPVVVLNTHLLANYSADWSSDNYYVEHQRSELEQLFKTIKSQDRHKLLLLAGDFNVPTHASIYSDFVRSAGLIDPLSASPQPTFRPPRFLPEHYALPLDHVLVRPPEGNQVTASARLVLDTPIPLVNGPTAYVSDHSGLELTVEMTHN